MKLLRLRFIVLTLAYLTLQACGSDTKSGSQEKASAPASGFKTLKTPIPFAGKDTVKTSRVRKVGKLLVITVVAGENSGRCKRAGTARPSHNRLTHRPEPTPPFTHLLVRHHASIRGPYFWSIRFGWDNRSARR